MKHILGLDLGTNSIGWAVIRAHQDADGHTTLQDILAAGSRIIPMDAATLADFDKGNARSGTAERTSFRSMRRRRERQLLRRERLHRVLMLLGFLPQHYANSLTRYGEFADNRECKLPWVKDESDGKYHFLFQDAFHEMCEDFRQSAPQWVADGKKVPYDWTLYYLRCKALSRKISKEELAWILLSFNQKRGYYQARDEEDEVTTNKLEEYYAGKVVRVDDTGERKGKNVYYDITLENGWVYRYAARIYPDWVGQVKEFIVTTTLNPDGTPKTDKAGEVKRSFRMPKDDDWTLIKKKTERDIDRSQETIGQYIYHALLKDPSQKIRGKLIGTVERKYYKDELRRILDRQIQFHPELRDRELYYACLQELYPSNVAFRNTLVNRDFTYLFLDDILFYQRPLKSKKSQISDCPYEEHFYTDKETGERISVPVKCIAVSHPLYQEYRLWQFIQNLRIYCREARINGNLMIDWEVTDELLQTEEDKTALFDWLNDKESVKQPELVAFLLGGKANKKQIKAYRWNYMDDDTKGYPCNETRASLLKYLREAQTDSSFLTREREEALWHILYSIFDKGELKSALGKFAVKHGLNERFVTVFSKFPPFKKDYGSYSAKALKKLLPLMRMGHHWQEASFIPSTRQRMEKFINGEYDDSIDKRTYEKLESLTEVSQYRGLPGWLACYVVYDRHSEGRDIERWTSPSDIDSYLAQFKQHSLHNPIVERVVLETLRTVRDIWKQVDHIDEIHIELGRNMKLPADKRRQMTEQAWKNEQTNLRIKALLLEFARSRYDIENVRPYSPYQQDQLRIYEEAVLGANECPDDISAILKKFNGLNPPTSAEVLRYKCWLEQKYRSPYTGRTIPLSKLFTSAYEIEHIIPKQRYFDDSFSNKVICESEVNKKKGAMLGYEFIKSYHGASITLNMGGTASIFSVEAYENFVKEHYAHNRSKMKKLLMDDVPDSFISRQLNDSRYISKLMKSILSNLVREEGEKEAISKNVIVCTGGITDRLKKDWGIHDVWNDIILPRFKRLDEMDSSHTYITLNTYRHPIPSMPLEFQRGFSKKRIDHRHHAMDAIVIACATRNIVNYLNNESARHDAKTSRMDLQRLLCTANRKLIDKPWKTFTQDTCKALEDMIVSFQRTLRIINKTKNYYLRFEDGKKRRVLQTKGDNWAIRKPLHKETFYGEINLRRIETLSLNKALERIPDIVERDLRKKLSELLSLGYNAKRIKGYFEEHKEEWSDVNLSKIKAYYFTKQKNKRYFAVRTELDTSFNKDKIENKIADTAIQKILLRHLEAYGNDADQAFSPEGIDTMNRNIRHLNGGRSHQPIYKVRVYEEATKFAVGQRGNKATKFVEAAKGTNLFFAIYEISQVDGNGNRQTSRTFSSIPLNVAVERLKQGLPPVPEDEEGNAPKYVLSPNDLVYLPTERELKRREIAMPIDKSRIYKMVSCTGKDCFFIPANTAVPIVDRYEYSSMNKIGRALTGEMIKEICLPLKIDRLGQIIEISTF